MIRVTVELDALGLGQKITELGTILIANDGTDARVTLGSYNICQLSKTNRVVKRARVEDHPRRSESIWKLVAKALQSLEHDVC